MAAEDRPRRLRERRYVIVSKETVRQHAESVGVADLSDEILEALAEDVSYRVREVIQVSGVNCYDLYCIRHVVYSATDILYAQHSLIGCSQATLVMSRDLGLASIWRPIF